MTSPKPYLLWMAVAIAAAAVGVWLARQTRPANTIGSGPSLVAGTWLPQPKPVADFHLLDARGQSISLSALRGRTSLVFFGFTHCPDLCPTTLALLGQIRTLIRPTPQIVFVSLDPERDTPSELARYLGTFNSETRLNPEFIGITGGLPDIKAMAGNFGVAFNKLPIAGGDYMIDHSGTIFVLDGNAAIRAVFTPPFERDKIAVDLHNARAALAP